MSAETWIPFLWAATGIVSLVVIVFMIYWASGHNQFDEQIKNQIFLEGDDDRYANKTPD